jgi:hypothetical protein
MQLGQNVMQQNRQSSIGIISHEIGTEVIQRNTDSQALGETEAI